jgi:hypothetical protein
MPADGTQPARETGTPAAPPVPAPGSLPLLVSGMVQRLRMFLSNFPISTRSMKIALVHRQIRAV